MTVTQTLLPAAEGGLLFWPTVLRWLLPWCERRGDVVPAPREIARLSVALYDEDPPGAARWPSRVFGLGSWSGVPAEGERPPWVELHHGNVAMLVLPLERRPHGPHVTHATWAYVDDVDAHFAHAQANGATILSPIEHQGFRAYTAEDPEGTVGRSPRRVRRWPEREGYAAARTASS